MTRVFQTGKKNDEYPDLQTPPTHSQQCPSRHTVCPGDNILNDPGKRRMLQDIQN